MKSVLLIRDPQTKEEINVWTKFDDFSRKVKQGNVAGKGGADSEAKYAILYQQAARLGLVQRLKRKYRTR
jgi:hypothetical protein